MTTLRLWWLLRRRSTGSTDPAGLTGVLAVIAFAVTTAVALVVVGGLSAFVQRAAVATGTDYDDSSIYVFLAIFATLLLLIPLGTLGGAAARLAVSRRDARLASLRLAGATTTQVAALTVGDAAVQALTGAVIGIAGYGALLPVVAQLRFQGRTFEVAELWVGVPGLLAAAAGIVLVALVSAVSSLGRVAITPLGIASRVTPPGLKVARVVAVVAVAAISAVFASGVINVAGLVGIFVLMGFIAAGMSTLNLLGPFLLGLVGKIVAKRATSVATLLAGRRLADDPKTAWRSVGGVALATFIAGITAIAALFSSGAQSGDPDAILMTDLGTGGLLTLAIAGVLAAVSTGVMQAGRVIDQRDAYRNLVLAGTDQSTLDQARFRETLIPLAAAVGSSAIVMLALAAPMVGFGAFTQPIVLIQYVLSIAAAVALVLAGSAATRVIARRVVA